MTAIVFTFKLPNGEPLANTPFEIHLSKSSYDDKHGGILMPRQIDVTTDVEGKALVHLAPSNQMYFMVMQDPESTAAIHYKFLVPEVDPPGTVVSLEDVIVDCKVSCTSYDEAALLIIQGAKVSAVAAANRAQEIADGLDNSSEEVFAAVALAKAWASKPSGAVTEEGPELSAFQYAKEAQNAASASASILDNVTITANTVETAASAVQANADTATEGAAAVVEARAFVEAAQDNVEQIEATQNAKFAQLNAAVTTATDAATSASQSASHADTVAGTIGVKAASVNSQGELIITRNNDTILVAGSVVGPKGDTGNGLNIKSTLDDPSELPTTGNTQGDAYMINQHIWIWNGASWVDGGLIQGPPGQDGNAGVNGKDVQLQRGTTHIQWRYEGDTAWTDLISIADLKGEKGDKGDPGVSTIAGISDAGAFGKSMLAADSVADAKSLLNYSFNKSDVGLSNVDNTSDASKPVSTATQAALDTKVDKVTGKQLSTEDYSTAEKSKLAGIASGATANATDTFLRDRANHTGVQALSTVSGLTDALGGKQPSLIIQTTAPTGISNGQQWIDTSNSVKPVEMTRINNAWVNLAALGGGSSTTVSPLDNGAIGDGVADDTTALQTTINVAVGRVIDLLGKTYKVSSTLVLPSNTTLINGTLNASTMANGDTLLEAMGTMGSSVAMSAISSAAGSFTVSSATGIAAQTMLYLESTTVFGYGAAHNGELIRVRSVSGTTVTPFRRVYDFYQANQVFYRPAMVKNIFLQNLKMIGGGDTLNHIAFNGYLLENAVIEGCHSFRFGDRHYNILRSTGVRAVGCHTEQSDDATGLSYGFCIGNGCDNITVTGCTGVNHRHGVAVGAEHGVDRYIAITGNTYVGCTDSPIDTHPQAQYVTITGNSCSANSPLNSQDGIVCQGTDCVVSNNIVTGFDRAGILLQPLCINSSWGADNTVCSNNVVTGAVTGSTPSYGIFYDNQRTGGGGRVTITGNSLNVVTTQSMGINFEVATTGSTVTAAVIGNNNIFTRGSGIRIYTATNKLARCINITGNCVETLATSDADAIEMVASSANYIERCVISNNTLYGGRYGINITNGSRVIGYNNMIQTFVTGAFAGLTANGGNYST